MDATLKFFLSTDSQLGMADNFLSREDRKQYTEKWFKNSEFERKNSLENPNNIGLKKELENLKKIVSIANIEKPDFFVITGDMIDDIHDDDTIKKFQSALSNLDNDIELFLVPGNHDVGEDPLIPSSSGMDRYEKFFGNDYYSFEKLGILFIVINSSLFMAPDALESRFLKQNAYLKKIIESQDSQKPIIFFSHHPPYLSTDVAIDDDISPSNQKSEGYWEFPRATREILFEYLKERNVLAFFSGHLHHNQSENFNNVEIVVTSALGLPLGEDPSGYRIVEIKNQKLKHTFYSL
jgi:Icc-related predicted phosphoesterase